MFSRILVPIDFSEYTTDILTYATEIAQKFSSTIHLIHVIPTMNYFAPYESFMSAENIVTVQGSGESEVERDLAEVANKITGIAGRMVSTGQGDFRTTFSAALPMISSKPPLP